MIINSSITNRKSFNNLIIYTIMSFLIAGSFGYLLVVGIYSLLHYFLIPSYTPSFFEVSGVGIGIGIIFSFDIIKTVWAKLGYTFTLTLNNFTCSFGATAEKEII